MTGSVRPTPRALVVFGTRPEAVKLAPVIAAARATGAGVEMRVCVTGQHREMVAPILEFFDIRPDHDLALMTRDQQLGDLTGLILREMNPVFDAEQPDWVVVQGDTTTAFAASLAAFYRGIPVAHVEAGLRTGDKRRPFPEEANRRIIDTLADLHFTPTEGARRNLLLEGTDPATVHVTGNTVIDALHQVIQRDYDVAAGALAEIPFDRRIVLVTAHRRESFGEGLAGICDAIVRLVSAIDGIHIVYPVHLNPNVHDPVHRMLGGDPRISLVPPLDYVSLVQLMSRATLILTDSGGIQEEAPSLGKPVLVLRDTTERPEAVEAGCARIVGTDSDRIFREARRLLDDRSAYEQMARVANPFGDGHAGQRIVQLLRDSATSPRATPVAPVGVPGPMVRAPAAVANSSNAAP